MNVVNFISRWGRDIWFVAVLLLIAIEWSELKNKKKERKNTWQTFMN